jgi:hypothetical protein
MKKLSHTSFQVPRIIVIRDMSLASKLSNENPVLIKYAERKRGGGGGIKEEKERRGRKNEEISTPTRLAHIFSNNYDLKNGISRITIMITIDL